MNDPVALLSSLPPEQVRIAIQAEQSRRSLEDFWKGAWPVHHPATDLIWNWHIPAICEHLQAVTSGDVRNLVINVPPGMGKSLGVSVYWPSWEWATNPHLQYIAVGAVQDVVLRDARRMHEIVDSEWYQESFMPQWGWDSSQDAKGNFYNSAGGFRLSKTTGQLIIGLRGDRIIIDDPLDASDAFSDKAKLEQVCQWIEDSLINRVNSPISPKVLIMQRLHERDPSNHFIEEYDPVVLVLPNEYDGQKHHTVVGHSDPREVEGELLFPALFGASETERKKRKRVSYACQYQQQPVPAEGIIFQEKFFKFWNPDHLPKFDLLVGSWDLNDLKRKKATRDTDYVCGQVWGAAGLDRYLLGQFREKVGLLDSQAKILAQHTRWPQISKILIEAKANGPSVIAALSAKPELARLIEGVNVQGESKVQRATACQPVLEEGHVYIPPPAKYKWVKELFIPEVCGFPNRRRDDQVDSMTMALIWLQSKRKRGLWSARAG
jgi:predicted phage terminase large subunit-like protein